MMDSRRWPRMACESSSVPSPSGPRWRSACSMSRMPLMRTALSPTIPAIPHILLLLPARGERGFKHPLVSLSAPLDEKVLDLGEIVAAHRCTTLGSITQCLDGLIKGLL